MFARFDYPEQETEARARILYFMQLGYHALVDYEPMEQRMKLIVGYLESFSGRKVRPEDYSGFVEYALAYGDK